VFVHICSTKIPYKTVGKEFISDRPEVEREILGGVREVARRLSLYLSRRKRIEREVKRYDIFKTYLPKIAKFSTELAGKTVEPDLRVLLESFLSSSPKESVKEL
jgi:DNA topoisomerase-6 subunit B